jgi:hypothetical protein
LGSFFELIEPSGEGAGGSLQSLRSPFKKRTGLRFEREHGVRKYLRSDSVEPKFNIPDRPSKLDPYADKLSQTLRQEAGKSRKQKRTTKQLHADLTALGYDGS